VKTIRYIIWFTLFFLIFSGCDGSSSNNTDDQKNINSETLFWGSSNWDNSNWQ